MSGNDSNLSAIGQILAKTVDVEVSGVSVTLHQPEAGAILEVRTELTDLTQREGDVIDATASLTAAAHAVQTCIPGIDKATAIRLVVAAGGEQSELVMEALAMCGLRATPADEKGGETPGPT